MSDASDLITNHFQHSMRGARFSLDGGRLTVNLVVRPPVYSPLRGLPPPPPQKKPRRAWDFHRRRLAPVWWFYKRRGFIIALVSTGWFRVQYQAMNQKGGDAYKRPRLSCLLGGVSLAPLVLEAWWCQTYQRCDFLP
jgi:hypothetical protein